MKRVTPDLSKAVFVDVSHIPQPWKPAAGECTLCGEGGHQTLTAKTVATEHGVLNEKLCKRCLGVHADDSSVSFV